MPLYEFHCQCGNTIERLLKFSDDLPICTKCGHRMKRTVSCTNFILKKGTIGWGNEGYSKGKE